MQPLQSSIISPPISRQAIDTPQLPPDPIKNAQSIKSPSQKTADKAPDDSGNKLSLGANEEVNLFLLSLVNQLIGQMQGIDNESPAGTNKPETSGKESTAKVETPPQPTSGEVSTTEGSSEKIDGDSTPTTQTASENTGNTASTTETASSSVEINALDEEQISEEKPVLADENTAPVSDTPPTPETEIALEILNAEPPQTRSEGTTPPDGLRSLEKFNISLIGFSNQSNDKINDIFKDNMFMNGQFHTIRND